LSSPSPAGESATPVTVLLDPGVPQGVEAELKDALGDLGFEPSVKDFPITRGPEMVGLLGLMMIPLKAFLEAAGSSLGEQAVSKFKQGVTRILHRGASTNAAADSRPLVLRDSATGIQVFFEPGLPDEAYRALPALDLGSFVLGPVHWDRALGRWRSIADEALDRQEPRD
jgi:hypothetical protein